MSDVHVVRVVGDVSHPPSEASEQIDKDEDSAISDELRNNFEAMRSIQQLRSQHSGSVEIASELDRTARAVAVKTALAIDDERRRWEQGIAELEQLLASNENLPANDPAQPEQRNLHVVPILSLSDVVRDDDDDDHDVRDE